MQGFIELTPLENTSIKELINISHIISVLPMDIHASKVITVFDIDSKTSPSCYKEPYTLVIDLIYKAMKTKEELEEEARKEKEIIKEAYKERKRENHSIINKINRIINNFKK